MDLKPELDWAERFIGEFEDDPKKRRVFHAALMDEEVRLRIQMLLESRGHDGLDCVMTFRQGMNPRPGTTMTRGRMERTNRLVSRFKLPRQEYPLDVYWEEIEWIEFDSPLPSAS